MKLFTALAALTVIAAPVQAGYYPAWARQTANRTCYYLDQGHTAERSGQLAAADVLQGPQSGAVMRAYNNGTMQTTLTSVLIETCHGLLMEAGRRGQI